MRSVDESPLVKQTSNRDLDVLHARLTTWFAHTLGRGAEPSLSPLTSPGKAGMSNETLLFGMRWKPQECAERDGRFVCRLPPPADAYPLFPDYDFDRQVGAMRLVAAKTAIPVPRVPWQERGADFLGAPFYIMERIEGEMVSDNPPYVFGGWLAEATPSRQREVQDAMVGILADLHGMSATEEETAFLQVPHPGESPLRRYFEWKKALYEWGRDGMRFPLVERLIDWLEARWPAHEGPAVVTWGDARPANVLWRDGKPVAVLDWEIATVGPRELDVGYMIFFHRYFQHIARAMAGIDVMPDFMRCDDVMSAYASRTGTCLQEIDWFITYGLLHQAVTEIRITQRRILFGEIERPRDPDDYLFSRGLIEQVLENRPGVWTQFESANHS